MAKKLNKLYRYMTARGAEKKQDGGGKERCIGYVPVVNPEGIGYPF